MASKFMHDANEELTGDELKDYIKKHRLLVPRYQEIKDQYESNPPILHQKAKEAWKPDNRLVVNFAKYLVDTFNGYFLGIPIKVSHDDQQVNDLINEFWNVNDMDDTLSELGKTTSLFGVGYLYMFQNEDAQTRAIYNDPLDMFLIYDDTIEQRPLYAVRYVAKDEKTNGTLVTRSEYIDFTITEDHIAFDKPTKHYFPTLPVIEFEENEEHQSLIEPVETLINAFNKSLSEKANDVDYFADAYLAILGEELDEESTVKIRDNRIINIFGIEDASNIVVEFLEKPSGDDTQENLLDRLERLIYQTSMVSNITDESFGDASGVAMEFKLQPMKNLSGMKERKFTRSLNQMMRNFMSLSTNVPPSKANEWTNVTYRYTRNIPRNVQDEAKMARELDGIVSDETKLSVLSIVDNTQKELERIDKENARPMSDMEQSFIDSLGAEDE